LNIWYVSEKDKPAKHLPWQKKNSLGAEIPQVRVKFKVGDLATVTKESYTGGLKKNSCF